MQWRRVIVSRGRHALLHIPFLLGRIMRFIAYRRAATFCSFQIRRSLDIGCIETIITQAKYVAKYRRAAD